MEAPLLVTSPIPVLPKVRDAKAVMLSESTEAPLGAVATISMFFGSSNSRPFWPCGAVTFTCPAYCSTPWLETST